MKTPHLTFSFKLPSCGGDSKIRLVHNNCNKGGNGRKVSFTTGTFCFLLGRNKVVTS